MNFIPSKYQQNVFDWLENSKPTQNLIVEARAGSGKSTTIEKGHAFLPKDATILDCAFNKHIATAMQERLPDAFVKTYHALGLRSVTNAFGRMQVNSYRNDDILKQRLGKGRSFMFGPIKRLTSLFKANLDVFDYKTAEDYILYYGIDTNDIEGELYYRMLGEVDYLINPDNLLDRGEIDFDDMCWLPVKLDLPCENFDFVFIDELQDTNKGQIELALKHTNGGSRIIGVGDRYQSIYGWRGADVEAIPSLIERLTANTLPLSITYRNPQKIVDLVMNKFPEIGLEARDNAPDGILETIGYSQFMQKVKPGDMVLCRTNAPLVAPAMQLISNGTKAVIRGRNIGENLKSLVKKVIKNSRPATFDDFLHDVQEYCNTQIYKLRMIEKDTQANILQDQKETLMALIDYCNTTDELIYRIDSIFSDTVIGITFSSVHRAKGLESENIFVLKPELIPHPKAKPGWQMKQEENLWYVAVTRSLNALYWVV